MKEFSLSIIITLFNRRDLGLRALKSALSQKLCRSLPVEIIIVDDGSEDNPLEVLGDFVDGNYVKYFSKANGGPASAKNYGALKAKGEYILFLDSDDFFVNESALDVLREAFINRPDLISFTSVLIKRGQSSQIDNYSVPGDVYDTLLQYPLSYVGHQPYVFKKQNFFNHGGLDENHKWGDALSFWRSFIQDADIFYISSCAYVYDQTDENSVSRSRDKRFYRNVLVTIADTYESHKHAIDSRGYTFNWGVIIFLLSIICLDHRLFFKWLVQIVFSPVKSIKSMCYIYSKRAS